MNSIDNNFLTRGPLVSESRVYHKSQSLFHAAVISTTEASNFLVRAAKRTTYVALGYFLLFLSPVEAWGRAFAVLALRTITIRFSGHQRTLLSYFHEALVLNKLVLITPFIIFLSLFSSKFFRYLDHSQTVTPPLSQPLPSPLPSPRESSPPAPPQSAQAGQETPPRGSSIATEPPSPEGIDDVVSVGEVSPIVDPLSDAEVARANPELLEALNPALMAALMRLAFRQAATQQAQFGADGAIVGQAAFDSLDPGLVVGLIGGVLLVATQATLRQGAEEIDTDFISTVEEVPSSAAPTPLAVGEDLFRAGLSGRSSLQITAPPTAADSSAAVVSPFLPISQQSRRFTLESGFRRAAHPTVVDLPLAFRPLPMDLVVANTRWALAMMTVPPPPAAVGTRLAIRDRNDASTSATAVQEWNVEGPLLGSHIQLVAPVSDATLSRSYGESNSGRRRRAFSYGAAAEEPMTAEFSFMVVPKRAHSVDRYELPTATHVEGKRPNPRYNPRRIVQLDRKLQPVSERIRNIHHALKNRHVTLSKGLKALTAEFKHYRYLMDRYTGMYLS